MIFPFDPSSRLIRIPVVIVGRNGPLKLMFALDTGCSRTCASEITIRRLGYDTSLIPRAKTVRATTGLGTFGEVEILGLAALGVNWDNPTIAFRELGTPRVDGLLGLDFFRGRVLTVDFLRGTVALNRPWRWFLRR